MTREVLIVGSPLAVLAGLPLALWQGRCLRCVEVWMHLVVLCIIKDLLLLGDVSTDDGRWILEART